MHDPPDLDLDATDHWYKVRYPAPRTAAQHTLLLERHQLWDRQPHRGRYATLYTTFIIVNGGLQMAAQYSAETRFENRDDAALFRLMVA